MRLLMLLILAGVVIAEELPLRMATEGRVDFEGHAIKGVEVDVGKVTRDGESWVVTFPIDWWRWREVAVTIDPAEIGSAKLSLGGPWAEEDGIELRQEILWRSVDGVDFERGRLPRGWSSPWRAYPKPDGWPIEGKDLAASWHGRPLVSEVELNDGEKRTIQIQVRAAVPPGAELPKRLEGVTTAHRAASGMKRGVNLGNCWEGAPGSEAVRFTTKDIDQIADSGFDHVRVPVGWHHRIESGEISQEFLDELEPILRRVIEKKMSIVLNWQGYDAMNENPARHSKAFVDGWSAIANHFQDWPPGLIFELFNEPNGGFSGEVLNQIHAEVIRVVRVRSPLRILMVDAPEWASSDALGALSLPDGDDRIIASFHCYDPFRFTHQGAEWVGLGEVMDVGFGGRLPAEVERRLDDAVAWSKFFGRPVYLGEFGVTREADDDSRRAYAREIREAAEKRGIPWCWWEWKAGFGCWDGGSDEPLLIEALMGS